MTTAGECVYSADPELDKQINLWLKWDRNNKTLTEIQDLVDRKDWDTLRTRLLKRLEFGTAGLRGVMRAGFNAMNDLVIIQAAQGLCEYMCTLFGDEDRIRRGIVFGYDGRHHSKRFAELSSTVFAQNGFKVWMHGRMTITPFVPFAILQLKCLAGVMVTASHNPKDDNGYKVYWQNGAQIIPPHDKCIQEAILRRVEPCESSWNVDYLCIYSLFLDPYDYIFDVYYKALLCNLPQKFLDLNGTGKMRFVYTAMHGVGYPFAEEAFRVANLCPLVVVPEQRDPDPEFPTVKYPNPEEGKTALELSIKKAEAENLTVILANDPDADRLACAEKDPKTGAWKIFSGNELGALLGWWALKTHKALHPIGDLSKCYMIASTVSSKILRAMGCTEGFKFEETLTGFKWMGNRAVELMAEKKTVLFAFEEAIGFMFSTDVLDKDGVSAACHLATMATHLRETKCLTLTEQLDRIYHKYGYHCTNCSYLYCHDPAVITRIFTRLRQFDNGKPDTYPSSILNGEFPIQFVRDLTTGVDTSMEDKRAKLPVDPSSQMITFTFENGLVVTLRTSGTEPKIKYYAELCAQPCEKDWPKLRETLNRMVVAIVQEFYQPAENGLTAKAD